jgi:hypothetical protein
MIDDQNNPHTLHQSGYMASFFKKNTACGVNDDWDSCNLSCWSSGGHLDITINDKHLYHGIIGLLECVYHSGEFNAKKEIRKILGVKE